jgi:hypothetical protein
VNKIGKSLDTLAREKAAGTIPAMGQIDFVDTNFGAGGAAGAAIAEVCNALAMKAVVPEDDDWTPVGQFGPGDCPALSGGGFSVKFVFEGPDDLIIVVPHADSLAYGFDKKPMKEAAYVTRTQEVRELAKHIAERTAVEVLAMAAGGATPDAADIAGKIEEILDAEIPVLDDESVFYEQLGSYSIRQCD